jgi:hypothetical protein
LRPKAPDGTAANKQQAQTSLHDRTDIHRLPLARSHTQGAPKFNATGLLGARQGRVAATEYLEQNTLALKPTAVTTEQGLLTLFSIIAAPNTPAAALPNAL